MAGTIILGIAYGLKVQPVNDPNVEIAEKGLHAISTASSPGAAIFDLFPMSMTSSGLNSASSVLTTHSSASRTFMGSRSRRKCKQLNTEFYR